MNFACSVCGSRDWPRLDTSCPQCYGEPDTINDDYDNYKEEETNNETAQS